MASTVGRKPGSPAIDLVEGRVLGAASPLEHVLGDVDEDRSRAARLGEVEGLAITRGDVVGVADQVVVLGHRQGDAGDVDLLESVLADEGSATLR